MVTSIKLFIKKSKYNILLQKLIRFPNRELQIEASNVSEWVPRLDFDIVVAVRHVAQRSGRQVRYQVAETVVEETLVDIEWTVELELVVLLLGLVDALMVRVDHFADIVVRAWAVVVRAGEEAAYWQRESWHCSHDCNVGLDVSLKTAQEIGIQAKCYQTWAKNGLKFGNF